MFPNKQGKDFGNDGLRHWETAQNLNQLHVKKAERENLRMTEDVVPLDIDNHEIHIDEHVRL